ncbi:hypothetical protein VTN96DRAFT_9807 [Rasamsonia emersonii]
MPAEPGGCLHVACSSAAILLDVDGNINKHLKHLTEMIHILRSVNPYVSDRDDGSNMKSPKHLGASKFSFAPELHVPCNEEIRAIRRQRSFHAIANREFFLLWIALRQEESKGYLCLSNMGLRHASAEPDAFCQRYVAIYFFTGVSEKHMKHVRAK